MRRDPDDPLARHASWPGRGSGSSSPTGAVPRSPTLSLTLPVVTTRLGTEIERAIRRAKLTQAEAARQAGVTQRWLASVTSGGKVRPDPGKLARLADVIGLDLERMLALSDQLGAPIKVRQQERAAAGDLAALVDAISAQTVTLESLAHSVADLVEAQHELDRAVARLVATLSAVLAIPETPAGDEPKP